MNIIKKFNMKNNIYLCVIVVLISGIIALYMSNYAGIVNKPIVVSPDSTLRQIAQSNDIPVKKILHILSHDDPSIWKVSRNQPIRTIAIDSDVVGAAVAHIKEEFSPIRDAVKFIFLAFYLSFILLFIFNLKNMGKARIIILICTVFIFGIAFGATPNPMESLVKIFKLFNEMEGEGKMLISIFLIFSIFSLIGSKFICSWGCPIGSLQECLFNVMEYRSKHSIRIPFWLYSMLRIFIFGVFLALLFGFGNGIVYGFKDFVIYHHVNYFKIFNFYELAKIALYTLPVFITLSLFIFRPFCHFICPFGLYSWLLENIAINRIHIDTKKCIQCEKCVNVCPTNAMKDIYNKKVYFRADCWSCGKCKDICPVDAITYTR